MKIILSPDSFKGSLSARDAAEALERGIHRVLADAECVILPIADGGEGTLETLVEEAELRSARVRGTDGTEIEALYGVRGRNAVIEMARAAGLTLVPEEKRDPMSASTYGVGQLILAALDAGCNRILLTVGGSGTNDGGSGMFTALGGRLLDAEGNVLSGCAASLGRVAKIDASGLDPRLQGVLFGVASDVTNPLLGEKGATRVYGPQKGLKGEALERVEEGMGVYAKALCDACGHDVASIPACGAGGGLIAPLLAFCRVQVRSGIESVLDAAGFDAHLDSARAVITGEGRVDGQSCYGKAISGVAAHAKAKGVAVYVAAGSLGEGWEQLLSHGICGAESLIEHAAAIPKEERLSYCMENASSLLEEIGESIARGLRSDY